MPVKRASPSLIALETAAIQLAENLQSEASLEGKRCCFFRFFLQMAGLPEQERFRSYYLQFASSLLPLCHELHSSNRDPEELCAWLQIADKFMRQAPEHLSGITEAEHKIRLAAILQFLYLQEASRAAALMGMDAGESPIPSISPLAAALALAERAPQPLWDELLFLVQEWQAKSHSFSAGSVQTVLIDNGTVSSANSRPQGVFLALHADARERPGDAEEDRGLLNNQVYFGKHALYWTIMDGLLAARSYMAQGTAGSHYTIHFSLPEKSAEVGGTSIGLAAALLAWSTSRNRHYRTTFVRIADSAAVTGGIRPDGAVTAVDSLSLGAKIATAFFSPLERLFLPAANHAEALRLLAELEKRYPGRRLLLQPLETLDQALRDRNLIENTRVSPPGHALAALRRIPNKAVVACMIAAAALALLLALAPDLRWWGDRVPARAEIVGEELIVRNRDDQKLWSRRMGIPLTPRTYELPENNRVVFDDLDGDGTKEVLIAISESAYPEHSGVLCGFDHRGRELWPPIRLGTELEKLNGEKIEDRFYAGPIVTARIYPDQPKMILIAAGSFMDYAARLVLIDYHGKVRGSYWNSGHIPVYMAYDTDGDGRREIIAGFFGNEEGRARLAVFSPEEMWGASPQSGPYYILAGIPQARHIRLYRFPKSPFWERGVYRDALAQIELFGNCQRVHIVNRGILKNELLTPVEEMKMYWYQFSSSLEPIALGAPPDWFLGRFRDIFGREFGPADRARLAVIDAWDGKSWKPFVIGRK